MSSKNLNKFESFMSWYNIGNFSQIEENSEEDDRNKSSYRNSYNNIELPIYTDSNQILKSPINCPNIFQDKKFLKFGSKEMKGFSHLRSSDKLSTRYTSQTLGSGSCCELQNQLAKEEFLLKCEDKEGAMEMKQKIASANLETLHQFLRFSEKEIVSLSLHKFGNFPMQALIERGGIVMVSKFREMFKGKLITMSNNIYACRVVQALVKTTSENLFEQSFILEELIDGICELVKDSSGNHVVQMMLETFPLSLRSPILSEIVENIQELISHKFGSRVIQKALESHESSEVIFILK